MADYRVIDTFSALRESDGLVISQNDTDRTNWNIYQNWLFAGNVPDPSFIDVAKQALVDSDHTLGRCTENKVEFPPEWVAFRSTLRDVVSGRIPGQLVTRPAYPAGS